MDSQRPTVGRIVNFFGDIHDHELKAYAALIAEVFEPSKTEIAEGKVTSVTLWVFDPKNGARFEYNITQGDELRNWNWIPRV